VVVRNAASFGKLVDENGNRWHNQCPSKRLASGGEADTAEGVIGLGDLSVRRFFVLAVFCILAPQFVDLSIHSPEAAP
jgi:hypothetical protein